MTKAKTILKENWLAFVIVAAVIIFFPIALWPLEISYRNPVWTKFGAWATYAYFVVTVFTLAAIVGAAIYARRQLEEISRSRKLTVISYLLNERLDSKETLRARDVINDTYCEHPEYFHSLEGMPLRLRKYCRQVFYVYSEFGGFLERHLIEQDFVTEALHTNAAIMWIILKHYAWDSSKIRDHDKYMQPFQNTADLGFGLLKETARQEEYRRLIIHHSSDSRHNKIISSSQVKKEHELVRRINKNLYPRTSLTLPPCTLPCCVGIARLYCHFPELL